MYTSGIETRKKIIASAKKLFYKNGLSGTTATMITKDAVQRQSLFFYYFRDIADIAQQIYDEFQIAQIDLVDQYLGSQGYTDLEMVIIRGLAQIRLILSDKRLSRFAYEVCYQSGIRANDTVYGFYSELTNKYIPSEKKVSVDFVIAQTLSLSACLFRMNTEDRLTSSLDDIIRMKTESSLRTFYLEGENLERIKERCLKAEETIRLKTEPYFKVRAAR